MTAEHTTVKFQVAQVEVDRSGLDTSTFVLGLARRKAVEAKKQMGMIEHRFDEGTKMHHAVVYLRGFDG